jgi:hypothetical protein
LAACADHCELQSLKPCHGGDHAYSV